MDMKDQDSKLFPLEDSILIGHVCKIMVVIEDHFSPLIL
jgi:hypothetical protein